MSRISLTNGIELPEIFDGLVRVQTSAFSANVLAALYSNAGKQAIKTGDRWQIVPDPGGDAIIVLFDQTGQLTSLSRFRVQSSELVFAMNPQGGWVVGRTRRRIGTDESRDTAIYGWNGEIISLFDAGGGTAFIQTNDDGSFWIGHDDDDPPDDLKRGGVSYFTSEGSEVFYQDWSSRPDTPENDGMPFWCCYALNAGERSAWTQHYTSMLITCFDKDGSARSWATENTGAVALAVKDDIVARIGRYDENQYKISAFRLREPPQSEFIGRVEFDVEGQKPKCLDWVEGKGDTFHVVHDSKWYRLTLGDIIACAGVPL